MKKLLIAVPAVALLMAATPTPAEARTKTIVKYGAIGLGVAALANMSQQNSYYRQPHYGGYYQQPYYGGYYGSPYTTGYNYNYSYSSNYYPSYGYYY